MEQKENTRFDWQWRDDVFNQDAIDLPLVLPPATKGDGGIQIKSQFKIRETVFGKDYYYNQPREIIGIVRRSNEMNRYQVTDQDGQPLESNAVLNLIFPPKAWMTDSAEERCMMFSAAQCARGNVLVGGLGLAIYPQMVFALNRPVRSITIVEKNRTIIDMIKTSTMVALNGKNVNIIENSIENFLDNSSQSFDTIYLDTWEDGDPRYLAHVNYLVQLALKRLSKEGQIQCWGYFGMDYNGHGTHCAGIIAGTANNNKGISGIAPGVKLMPVRAGFSMKNNLGDEYGLLENDDIVNAIYYAVDSGADIISMSFGGPENLDVGIAIQYAASQGVILVAAAGNSGVTECSYPAAFNQVIAVAATGQNNDKAYYSNFGAWVDVAAPGGDKNLDSMILSTVLLRL